MSIAGRGARVAVLGALLCLGPRTAAGAEFSYIKSGQGGRIACGDAPRGWWQADFEDRDWRDLSSAVARDAGICSGTLFERWRFDVASELPRLRVLELRIRYSHGLAVFVNGVEIVRRRLEPNAPAAAAATEFHGAELETIWLPLAPGLLKPKSNLLAVEVHPLAAGREPVLDLSLAAAEGARLVRGPYLERLGAAEARVVFETDLPTLGEVRYGPTESYGQRVADETPALRHALRLAPLHPGTLYHYRVSAHEPAAQAAQRAAAIEAAIDDGDARFRTLTNGGRRLRFVVYGDIRTGHDVHAQLVRSVAQENPDLVLIAGDLVAAGSDEGDWERFFELERPLLRQFGVFPVAGNHDYARQGRGAARFFALWRAPLGPGEEAGYYSFDAGGVHFAALDSNQYRSAKQLAWLERDLAQARKRGVRALFVFAHEGPYASGMHGDNAVCARDYVPILERYGVTMFLGGHDHHYERGRVGKLNYLVTGGGGAELRIPRCGVAGKPACPPRVAELVNEHHYVVLDVEPRSFRLCPKRPDGTPLAACATLPLGDR